MRPSAQVSETSQRYPFSGDRACAAETRPILSTHPLFSDASWPRSNSAFTSLFSFPFCRLASYSSSLPFIWHLHLAFPFPSRQPSFAVPINLPCGSIQRSGLLAKNNTTPRTRNIDIFFGLYSFTSDGASLRHVDDSCSRNSASLDGPD